MSYNGSGTFVINTAGQPVVSGTVISSTAFNALTADLATGLSTAITKDGQTTPTANIPMGNNKITGLAVGTAATDAATLSQVQSTAAKLIGSVSGADTITGTLSPTLGAYAAGQMFYFVAAGTNTGAVTINIDGLGAKAVTRDGSTALTAGDLRSGEVIVIVYDGTRFQVVSQVNSGGDATFANVSITSALNVGGVATFTGGTANGVTYLNGSKALTSGTALTFDGSASYPTFKVVGSQEPSMYLQFGIGYAQLYNSYGTIGLNAFLNGEGKSLNSQVLYFDGYNNTANASLQLFDGKLHIAGSGNVGIGTSSPGAKLDVVGTAQISSNLTLSAGTANGVLYLNASKVATSGSALTFDGTNLGVGIASPVAKLDLGTTVSKDVLMLYSGGSGSQYGLGITGGLLDIYTANTGGITFNRRNGASFTEMGRFDSSGNLGIGTSSPSNKLNVSGNGYLFALNGGLTNRVAQTFGNTGGGLDLGIEGSAGGTVFTGGSSYAGVIGTNNATVLQLGTNGTIRATLDTSGNLGLGVTPSAWGSTYKQMQVGQTASFGGNTSNNRAYMFSNAFFDGSAYKYITTSTATSYEQSDGAHYWFRAASGTAGNAITFTQAMTLDASGNLGVGITSPSFRLDASIDNPARGIVQRIRNGASSTQTGSQIQFTQNGIADWAIGQPAGTDAFAFWSGRNPSADGTERARITSGGDLLVGTTTVAGAGSTIYSSGQAKFIASASAGEAPVNTVFNAFTNGNSNNTDLIEFNVGQYQKTCMYVRNSGAGAGNTASHIVFQYGTTPTTAGSITSVGTTVTYGSASDVRLKTDLGVCETSRIPDIVIHDFEWKSTGVKAKGAFAQELHQVAPEAVVVGKDDVNEHGELKMPWQVDYSKLIPDLIVEIQSLRKRVAELETK